MLRLRLLKEKQAHFAAQVRAVTAELKLEEAALRARLSADYDVGPNDDVNSETGEITRQAPSAEP